MIGGEDDVVERLDPIFAHDRARGRTPRRGRPGRTGAPDPAEQGYLHCGPNGAGHFVKMVHNGIEYGMMAAYAEGLNILRNANVGKRVERGRRRDGAAARTRVLPVRHRHPAVAEVWRRGSVVASWLLDLTAARAVRLARPDEFAGRVSDSGEGRWTSIAAIDEGVPAPVLTTALYSRFASRGRRLRRQGAVGHAQGVRRPRREEVLTPSKSE